MWASIRLEDLVEIGHEPQRQRERLRSQEILHDILDGRLVLERGAHLLQHRAHVSDLHQVVEALESVRLWQGEALPLLFALRERALEVGADVLLGDVVLPGAPGTGVGQLGDHDRAAPVGAHFAQPLEADQADVDLLASGDVGLELDGHVLAGVIDLVPVLHLDEVLDLLDDLLERRVLHHVQLLRLEVHRAFVADDRRVHLAQAATERLLGKRA